MSGRGVAVALLLLATAVPSGAQDPEAWRAATGAPQGEALSGERLETATEELASGMRCPVCQGLSIADSPTLLAQAMKQEVHDMLAYGYTRQQVLSYFESSYGEFILLAPKVTGFNLFVWVAPVAVLAIGGLLVLGRLRRGQHRPQAVEPDLEPYLAQVRREVGR